MQQIVAALEAEIATLTQARDILAGPHKRTYTHRVKRVVSAAGKARMAEAQRKRWAKVRKAAA